MAPLLKSDFPEIEDIVRVCRDYHSEPIMVCSLSG